MSDTRVRGAVERTQNVRIAGVARELEEIITRRVGERRENVRIVGVAREHEEKKLEKYRESEER